MLMEQERTHDAIIQSCSDNSLRIHLSYIFIIFLFLISYSCNVGKGGNLEWSPQGTQILPVAIRAHYQRKTNLYNMASKAAHLLTCHKTIFNPRISTHLVCTKI